MIYCGNISTKILINNGLVVIRWRQNLEYKKVANMISWKIKSKNTVRDRIRSIFQLFYRVLTSVWLACARTVGTRKESQIRDIFTLKKKQIKLFGPKKFHRDVKMRSKSKLNAARLPTWHGVQSNWARDLRNTISTV